MRGNRSCGGASDYRLLEATVDISGPISAAQMAAIEARLGRRVTGGATRTPTFLIDLSGADGAPLDPRADESAVAVLTYLRGAKLAHVVRVEWRWCSTSR